MASKARDVSTVVSIIPIRIKEEKPGLVPGVFKLPAVEPGDFFLLPVERCMHPVYLDEARPILVVPDPSDGVAESIVNDYKSSMFGFIPGVAEPGISWVSGEFPNIPEGKQMFRGMHRALLQDLEEKQNKWFEALVEAANDDWGRFHQHRFITELQKKAAIALGLTNVEWLLQQQVEESMSRCKICFQMVDPRAIVCHHCHGVLDAERYRIEYVSPDSLKPMTRNLNVNPSAPSGSAPSTKPIGA